LIEAVELILARCRAQIRKSAQLAIQEERKVEAAKPLLLEQAEVMCVENWEPAPELCDERARLSRREQRYDRSQQGRALYEQGLGETEIARRVGLSRRTIQRWIKEGEFPEAKRRRKRRRVFDPYAQ
jgi:excisionase family DNA binding protein